jgi:hypothetical protein
LGTNPAALSQRQAISVSGCLRHLHHERSLRPNRGEHVHAGDTGAEARPDQPKARIIVDGGQHDRRCRFYHDKKRKAVEAAPRAEKIDALLHNFPFLCSTGMPSGSIAAIPARKACPSCGPCNARQSPHLVLDISIYRH